MTTTVEELEALYSEEKSIRGEDLIWRWDSNSNCSRLEASVITSGGIELLLRATFRKRYSFALLHRKTQLIRQWDTKRHKNPDRSVVVGPHKHRPMAKYGKSLAYNVDDIPPDDVKEGLLAFLKECNIKVVGYYQTSLFG